LSTPRQNLAFHPGTTSVVMICRGSSRAERRRKHGIEESMHT